MPASTRKFYRQVFTYEILSEEPISDMSLEDIAYQTSEGHMSGHFTGTTNEECDAKRIVELLREQGSDPEFFRLNADAEDVE